MGVIFNKLVKKRMKLLIFSLILLFTISSIYGLKIQKTSSSYTGNLGGTSGADAKCQSEFGASYKAIIYIFGVRDLNNDYIPLLNTIKTVFPYYDQFYFEGFNDIVILAYKHEIHIEDLSTERLEIPAVKENFALIKSITGEQNLSTYEFLKKHYHSTYETEAYIEKNAKDLHLINTDDKPILEYTTLRNRYKKFRK